MGAERGAPDLITVSWVVCADCPPAVAGRGGYAGAGHQAAYCNAAIGCLGAGTGLGMSPEN